MEKLCPAKKGCGRYTLTVEVANFFGVVQATKWSTLSAYFPLIDGFFVGSHPDICRIVKSIFEERPTLPKYSDTRDVKTVLDHLDVMSPMESLTLNKLTLKMCMLLSLVTDQRGHALYSLSMNDVKMEENKCVIIFSQKQKTSRPGSHPEPAEMRSFPINSNLCPVAHLRHYLSKTKKLRKGNQLFVSYMKPL